MADADELVHYGTPRHSGRYPWGSGQDPQHHRDFLGYVDGLKRQGMSDTDIAKGLGITRTQLQAARAIAKNETKKALATQALRLKDKGMSNVAIGQQLGINESSVRALTDPALAERRSILETTANMLKEKMGDGYLDVGAGTENHLGISQTKLAQAVAVLQQQGYQIRNIQVQQLGTSNKTTVKTLVPPDAPKFIEPSKIKSVAAYSEDGGRNYTNIVPPRSISSSRVGIRYAEQGGSNADGVIYVRPGVDDVSLGKSRYAQVRIAVDGTHYLKGMAMYKDDLPPGVDLLFNTNKHDTGNKLDALKPVKDDAENPFSAVIRRQMRYIDKDGKEQLSVMNIVNEEGNWRDWSKTLSSQFLSKQSTALASRQLALTLASKKDEFREISALTNPVVKKKLLSAFADGADSSAVHLKAAALPRQGTHVILPIESLKPNEIYAPTFNNGERVALIRFPHAGTFEIPEVTVNNRHAEARKTIGEAIDAVGIHPSVAERLSGADFDGDTVLVIPNNRGEVKTSAPLQGLKDFDPKTYYPPYDGMKTIDGGTYSVKERKAVFPEGKQPSGRAKQQQMGDVSNLITDMTIKGAKPDELARAVRHSMVVIDAEKHSLDYKRSFNENGIAGLKEKYQGRGSTGRLAGASTVISRSGNAKIKVPERRLRSAAEGGPIDPATGKKVYVETGATYVDKSGKVKRKLSDSTPVAEVSDVHQLSRGGNPMPIESIYATHSNALKALANEARKEMLATHNPTYSPSARKVYAAEVAKLTADLNLALKNKPLERQAQLLANTLVAAKLRDNPHLEAADIKKIKGQALVTARERIGAKKFVIDITPKEWEAIQAGAISAHRLSDILDNADLDKVKALATPRTALKMTESKVARARLMLDSGYTRAEVANALGVSVSTLYESLS